MDIQTDNQGYLTSRGAARLLNVSLKTIQLWVENGSLAELKTDHGDRHISCESVNCLVDKRKSDLNLNYGNRQLKVLVVEDEKVQLMMYQLKFKQWNLPVQLETAKNGFEALMTISSHRPDVLITDLNMPGMDGFQMVKALQSSIPAQRMKIIAITSLTSEDIVQQGGLPDSITLFFKPIPFNLLQEIFREMLLREVCASF